MPATETNGDPHHFDLSLDRAIKEQVVEKLENSPLLALEKNVGPRSSGIYALYHQENPHPVYLGKASKGTTKSERTLRARLNEHVSKIRGVQGLNLADMQCRYLTLASEWWVFAAEYALISATTIPRGTPRASAARSLAGAGLGRRNGSANSISYFPKPRSGPLLALTVVSIAANG